MSMLIPKEFADNINKYSGCLRKSYKYSDKNLKGLFFTIENEKYLANGVYNLINSETFVNMCMSEKNGTQLEPLKVKVMLEKFSGKKITIEKNIREMMEVTPLPYKEDAITTNPLQKLNFVNRNFLIQSSKNIIQNPNVLIHNFYDINPETGKDESDIEWQYSSISYSDGTWHPEHLFTNSKRNRENPYWVKVESNFYSDPEASGPGHRYYNNNYSSDRTKSQFPKWQYSVDDRPLERNINESLSDGGTSDRRVQRNRGYNMANLVSRSTY